MMTTDFKTHRAINLADALDLRAHDVVSLVGGGGKTSLMFRLAHELVATGKRVITTTTTRIMTPPESDSPCVIVSEDDDRLIAWAKEALRDFSHVTLARARPEDNKLKGLLPETVDALARLQLADCIINEADGASRLPLKAPNATEPVMPQSTSLVVAVVGIEAVGQPLSPRIAFRLELISRLTGLNEGQAITLEAVATLLTRPQGIIQHAPPAARIVPFINKVDLAAPSAAEALARLVLTLRHPQIARVALGSARYPEKEIEVISQG